MKPVLDKFGNELECGDSICFSVSMRIDQKPIIRVKVAGFVTDKSGDDWVLLGDPVPVAADLPPQNRGNADYDWACYEKKLPKKVIAHRVIKCY